MSLKKDLSFEGLEPIFVKESNVKKTRTRKAFLKLYLAGLYTTRDSEDKVQCASGKSRSISDLLALTRSRFPRTSLNAVIRIIAELNRDNLCYIVWCTQINKFVVHRCTKDYPFISKYTRDRHSEKEGEDGISYKDLIRIRDEEFSV